MSLASALLKRLFVSRALSIPFTSVRLGRKGHPKYGKPCALASDGTIAPNIDFNISHQAGLVALVGSATIFTDLGVDITCVNERNDYRLIDEEGFDGWVDVYEEIFSPDELWDMKYNVDRVVLLDGVEVSSDQLGRADRCVQRDQDLKITLQDGHSRDINSDLIIDAKLRRFYTFWSYKEAYIKLAGEGLLAKWLKELEFRNVRSPRPGTVARCSTHGVWGEKVADAEVWLHEKHLDKIKLECQSFEEYHMIAVAAKAKNDVVHVPELPPFRSINLNRDILNNL